MHAEPSTEPMAARRREPLAPAADDLETTAEEELLQPGSHTLLLSAVQEHAAELATALRRPVAGRIQPVHARLVLQALSALPSLDSLTRLTAEQVLAFLARLSGAPLPERYSAALRSLGPTLLRARTPIAVLLAVRALRESDEAAMMRPGLSIALELIGDALETSTLCGRSQTEVARACVRGSVWGALAGTLCGIGPNVAAVVGAAASSAQSAIALA